MAHCVQNCVLITFLALLITLNPIHCNVFSFKNPLCCRKKNTVKKSQLIKKTGDPSVQALAMLKVEFGLKNGQVLAFCGPQRCWSATPLAVNMVKASL